MQNKILFSAIFYLLNIFAVAQCLEINADINKATVFTGEACEYSIHIQGEIDVFPSITTPELENIKIISRGKIENLKIQKGKIYADLVYKFFITPGAVGDFEVKGFKVKYKDEEYTVDPITIKVQVLNNIPDKSDNDQDLKTKGEKIWL